MSETRCERSRELIPDFVSGRLVGGDVALVEAHLTRCPECSAEADLARMLLDTRPVPTAGLVERVRAAVAADHAPRRHPGWALSAAAVAVLALGIGVLSTRGTGLDGTVVLGSYVEGDEASGLWMAEDGMVAGGPVLDGLTDEALMQLLEELSAGGSSGGSA